MCIRDRDREAPMNIPIPAMKRMVLNEAALAPTAEFKKLTASLPVSYTHLDVYKRQALHLLIFQYFLY